MTENIKENYQIAAELTDMRSFAFHELMIIMYNARNYSMHFFFNKKMSEMIV